MERDARLQSFSTIFQCPQQGSPPSRFPSQSSNKQFCTLHDHNLTFMSWGYPIRILHFMLALKTVMFTLEKAMNAQRGSRCVALLFLYRLRWMGVSGQLHAPAALLPGRNRYPLYWRLGGPQGRSGRWRKVSPPPGFSLRTDNPVASRYTDCAIPAYVLTMKTFAK